MNESPFFYYNMLLYFYRLERSVLNTCTRLLFEQMNDFFKLLRQRANRCKRAGWMPSDSFIVNLAV